MTEKFIDLRPFYMSAAFTNPVDRLHEMRLALGKAGVKMSDFDTLVGTGLSGALVIPALAHALSKEFLIIRKPKDVSHSGEMIGAGRLGEKWLFVDDFISTGTTLHRVKDAVDTIVKQHDSRNLNKFATTYIGSYEYRWRRFTPPSYYKTTTKTPLNGVV